jgi:SRSO17 transposase
VAQTLGDPQAVLIVDGSGFPKQGEHSAGVARQYCGALGKIANCQEGVFAVYASQHGYAFVDARLYLHESWFDADHQRLWEACGIPKDQPFRTEPELALEMIQGMVARAVLPFQWVAGDEHFGRNPAFLDSIAALGKWYFAEVPCDTRVWLRTPPVEPPGRGLIGRARTHPRVKLSAPRAQEVQALVTTLPKSAWRTFLVQEGSKGPLRAEFAFLRVTTVRNRLPGSRVWAIFRRSLSAPHDIKYYLSNAPTSCLPRTFATLSGMRWPIETTLEEGKGEVGLDHYETRTWCGWHHHMAHTFIAHFFLMRTRVLLKKIPGTDHRPSSQFGQPNHQRATWFAQQVGNRGLSAAL